jgi:hypothetical protein
MLVLLALLISSYPKPLLHSAQNSCAQETGFIIPIVQMTKQRLREVK